MPERYSLDYVKVLREAQDSLKLNTRTHQLLAYADYVNILGGSTHTVKENAESLLVATKEIGLEVNADKTKYMVMSRDRNAGRGHSAKIVPLKGWKSSNIWERREQIKILFRKKLRAD